MGAMAATSEYNTGDDTIFAQKESKLRQKQERALRRTRKTAKKNLKLVLETESDENAIGRQTEASEVEGTMARLTNIESKGVAASATELSGNGNKVRAATDAMIQREEEEEMEEERMEKRRIDMREERAIHAMLQDNKAERVLEKVIQAEDDLVQEEKDDEIREELDEIFDENKKVNEVKKAKSYWNQPLPGGVKAKWPK